MKQNRRLLAAAAALVHLVLLCGQGGAHAAARQGPPADFADSFPVEGICAFPVLVELRGKAKTIALPGGSTLFTSPGLTAVWIRRSVFTGVPSNLTRIMRGLTSAAVFVTGARTR